MSEEQGYQPPNETNEPAERAEASSTLATDPPETLRHEITTKPDLWKVICEKAGAAGVVGLVLSLNFKDYTPTTAFEQFDEELGVYVIPDEAMSALSPIGGMNNGQAFNLLGHIGLKESTVDLIRDGNENARYELNHELSHNKYRETHLDFPYKSVEQNLIDEVYAHLDGFITTYGEKKLSEKKDIGFGDAKWTTNVCFILQRDYIGEEDSQREQIIKKLTRVMGIVELIFQHGEEDKIMAYIKQSTNFNELLGILKTEQHQKLVDVGSQIDMRKHEELRRKWVEFKPGTKTQTGE